MRSVIVWFLTMAAILSACPAGAGGAAGVIRGSFRIAEDKPLAGGTLFVFSEELGPPPSPDRYWRVPDYIERLDERGAFLLEVPAGVHYVIAMSRAAGEEIGPPRAGEAFIFAPDKDGNPTRYEVRGSAATDIGTISTVFPFRKDQVKYQGVTAAEGIVATPDGKPVAGALVFAYVNAAMLGRPLYVSEKTGTDGRFLIRFREGGTYFLKVRSLYGGGPPLRGEQIGDFRDRGPVVVQVKTGEKVGGLSLGIAPFSRGPGAGK